MNLPLSHIELTFPGNTKLHAPSTVLSFINETNSSKAFSCKAVSASIATVKSDLTYGKAKFYALAFDP